MIDKNTLLKMVNKMPNRCLCIFCYRVSVKGTNLHTEPKHIVLRSQLLLLFGFCHSCKTDNPMVDANQVGTEAVVTSTCSKECN